MTHPTVAVAPAKSGVAVRNRRLFVFAIGVALVALVKVTLTGHLLINYTPSIPRGLYWISAGGIPQRGDLVAIAIPDSVRQLVVERRYLPPTIKLLAKPVAAVGGDDVCVRDERLYINRVLAGHIVEMDRFGRLIPVDRFCGTLPTGLLFLATTHDNSFDSRNFGPVPREAVRGTLTGLLTF